MIDRLSLLAIIRAMCSKVPYIMIPFHLCYNDLMSIHELCMNILHKNSNILGKRGDFRAASTN